MKRLIALCAPFFLCVGCNKQEASPAPPTVVDPAAPHIAKLKDGSAGERIGAMHALAALGEQAKAAVPEIERALNDADDKVSEEAAKSLQVLAPESAPGRSSMTLLRLKQIGRGMLDYEMTQGTYPPTCTVANPKDGKDPPRPGLSWRVLLLPYLGHKDLFDQFKLDEPWDSDHNRKLVEKMPAVYASPLGSPGSIKPGETCFQVFTYATPQGFHQGSSPFYHPYSIVWLKLGPCRILDIQDGTSNTFLVVEAAKPVVWTKPEDVVVSDAPLPDLGHSVDDVFHVLMADGACRKLSRRASAYDLRCSIGRADGMTNNFDAMSPRAVPPLKETTRLRGRVIFRGMPFTRGWVVIHAADGREYGGKIGVDGSFLVTRAPLGKVLVTLALGDPLAPWMENPDAKLQAPEALQVDFKYLQKESTPLQVDVKETKDEVTLQLQ